MPAPSDPKMPPESGGGSARITAFSDAEMRAMFEMIEDGRIYAQAIYLYLRWHTDVRTGLVGEVRKISYQGIAEHLERRPEVGSRWSIKKPGKGFVREQIAYLVKLGMLVRVGPVKQLIFRVPALPQGKSVQMRNHSFGGGRNHTPEREQSRDISSGYSAGRAEEPHTKTGEEPHTSRYIQQQHTGAVPVDQVVALYHELMPGLPRVRVPDAPGIVQAVTEVWNEHTSHQSVEFFRFYLGECLKSDFLMGRAYDRRSGPFSANFKALVNVDRVHKVLNGEYT